MNELTYRKFQRGDEEAILALYRDTFGHSITREYWEWKYLNNPSGKVYVYLAFDGARCVGQYAMLPNFLSVNGAPVQTLVALDNMVHPDYQRRGILKKLEQMLAAERPDDIPFYTFLNENSFEVYIKKFGWKWLGDLDVMMKPLSVASLARRKPILWLAQPLVKAYAAFNSRAATAVAAEPFDTFDADVESLWQRNKSRVGVTMDRSTRLLDWRYNQSPVSYEKFKIVREGQVKGWVIVRVQEKFGANIAWVLDYFLDHDEPLYAWRDALLAVENRLRGRCDFLSLLLPTKQQRAAIKSAGYRRVPPRFLPHRFYFCVRRNDYSNADVLEKQNWYFSWSLHDTL
jgi:GNAT superfamily N-acetyltransferase